MILKNDKTEVKLNVWKKGFVDQIFFDENSTIEDLPKLENLLNVQEYDFLSLFQGKIEVVVEDNIIAVMDGRQTLKYEFKKKFEFLDNNGNILNKLNDNQLKILKISRDMIEKAMIYISKDTKWIIDALRFFSISLKIFEENKEYNKQKLINYLKENR